MGKKLKEKFRASTLQKNEKAFSVWRTDHCIKKTVIGVNHACSQTPQCIYYQFELKRMKTGQNKGRLSIFLDTPGHNKVILFQTRAVLQENAKWSQSDSEITRTNNLPANFQANHGGASPTQQSRGAGHFSRKGSLS